MVDETGFSQILQRSSPIGCGDEAMIADGFRWSTPLKLAAARSYPSNAGECLIIRQNSG